MSYNLFDYSKGGGCGCKLDPGKLKSLLSGYKNKTENRILVDLIDGDDAAVIEINPDICIIQTVDFFLPVVSDAFDFGRIAAANALSDVYAMGGKPIMALSILGWPEEILPFELAQEVLRGAEEICMKAGIGISGGHTIVSSEPIFGLSVSGIVNKKNLKRKNTCRPGDYIYISKPLGLGLIANAMKHSTIDEKQYEEFILHSTTLNTLGIELSELDHITAMTDVTGFGLLGHLNEMLAVGIGADLLLNDIPVIATAREIAGKMVYPNITTSNYNFVKDRCIGLDGLEFLFLCDPQTSGGLLFTSSIILDRDDVFCIGRVNSEGKIRIK